MNFSFLLNATFWQAVGSIATAGALFWMIWQNRYIKAQTEAAIKEYTYSCGWQEKEKAAELANYYQQKILPKIAYINLISSQSGFKDLLVHIRPEEMNQFTLTELKALTSDDICDKIRKCISDCEIFTFQFAEYTLPREMRAKFPSLATMSEEILHRFYEMEYDNLSAQLLNEIEYFSMCFNSKVADEEIVYQSLHQTFFSTVKVLYYKIAQQNSVPKDKFYTHTICLYRSWLERDIKNAKKQSQADELISKAFNPVKK